MSDIQFPNGLRIYDPHKNAPDWIKGQIVIERDKLVAWLQKQPDTVRLDIKRSKNDTPYASVNTFVPKADAGQSRTYETPPFKDDSIPF